MVWRPHCGPRLVRRSVATSGEAQDRIKAPPPLRTCTGTAVARAFGTVGHYCCLRPQILGPFVSGLRSLARMLYYSVGLYCLRALVSPTHAVFLSREKRSIDRSSESHSRRVQYAAQDAGRSAPRLQRPRWRVRGRWSGSQSRPGRAGRSLGHSTMMLRANRFRRHAVIWGHGSGACLPKCCGCDHAVQHVQRSTPRKIRMAWQPMSGRF